MKKLILLTIAAVITLAAFFTGCKGPNTPSKGGGASSQQQGGSSTPEKITITVAGDKHVTLKAEKTFAADKGKTWHQLQALAEDKIDYYNEHYGLDKWKLTNAAGHDLIADYVFNANTTVFVVTKQITTPLPSKIMITVEGDAGVILKADPTFEVAPGKHWDEIEALAKTKIQKYKSHYELKNWRLSNASGQVLDDSYRNKTGRYTAYH